MKYFWEVKQQGKSVLLGGATVWDKHRGQTFSGSAQGAVSTTKARGTEAAKVQSTKCKASSWEKPGLWKFCCTSFRGTEQTECERHSDAGFFPPKLCKKEGN